MKVKVCPKCYNIDKDKLEKTADKFDIMRCPPKSRV